MSKDQLATDLDNAASYMDKHGQTTKKFVSLGGRVCAVGALQKTTSSGRTRRAWRHLDKVVDKQFGKNPVGEPLGITGVNDAKLANIPKLFRKEAARLRGGVRKGGCTQERKDAREAAKTATRQHMGAALAIASVVALIMLIKVIITILLVAVGLGLAYVGYCASIAFFEWVDEKIDLETYSPNWAYVLEWQKARQPLALPEVEPIALPYTAPITTDQVLKDAWTTEKEYAWERTTSPTGEGARSAGTSAS